MNAIKDYLLFMTNPSISVLFNLQPKTYNL